jgi:predicted TIM-barrel enzyme
MAVLRQEILSRLAAVRAEGRPIVMGGAGVGLVAKVLDAAGIDIIMAYNTGPFRMDGHGSLAGYLAYGDSNQMTLDLAGKILPVVKNTPVIAGIGAADPYRNIDRLIDQMMELGYSGITNVPTAGIYDGRFRQHIDATNLGYPEEVRLVRACREKDIFTVAYAFTPDEARAMAAAGADIIGAHVGLTIGGMIGAQHALDLDDACRATEEMVEAAVAERSDVMVVAHGGPFDAPAAVRRAFETTGVHGYLGASSIERLPVEDAITKLVGDFKSMSVGARSKT